MNFENFDSSRDYILLFQTYFFIPKESNHFSRFPFLLFFIYILLVGSCNPSLALILKFSFLIIFLDFCWISYLSKKFIILISILCLCLLFLSINWRPIIIIQVILFARNDITLFWMIIELFTDILNLFHL